MLCGVETSDVIAIVATSGTVLSFGVAGWALVYARSQAGTAKDALAASKRAAIAGEKSAEAADKAAQEAQRSAEAAEEANRIAARALELAEPPAVAWQIEPRPYGGYNLRNIGTQTATGVTADASRVSARRHSLPTNATVPAGDAVRFGLSHPPTALYVTWDGQAEPVAVAIPPRTSAETPKINTRRT